MKTLDEQLAACLVEAEGRFGPRHNAHLTIGPVLADRDDYAETILCGSSITVHIGRVADQYQTQYQLTHEAVHCLYGECRRETTYFEEGLANYAALSSLSLPRRYRDMCCLDLKPPLTIALARIERLRINDAKIRRLRELAPGAADLKPDILCRVFRCPTAFAEALCQRLPMERPETM